MRVASPKYRFCGSVDPIRYDTLEIRGEKGLEVMVQTYIGNRPPFLELYGKFARIDEGPRRLTYVLVR